MIGVILVILILLPWAIIRAIEIGPIFIVLGVAILLIGGFFSIPTGEQKNWKPLLVVLLVAACFMILGGCFTDVFIRDLV